MGIICKAQPESATKHSSTI